MAWARLDDQFFSNPKVVDLSKDAKLLYLAGVTYCASQLTDGRITPGALRIIAATVDADRGCARELLSAGLWKQDGDDHIIHDFLEYNPAAADVRARREADRARKRPPSNEGSPTESEQNPAGIRPETTQNPEAPARAQARHPVPNPNTQYPVTTETQETGDSRPHLAPAAVASEREMVRAVPKPLPERDPIWDALAEQTGAPATKSERSDFGRTVSEIKAAGATPDEIAAFAPWWYDTWPNAKLTHHCYRDHLGKFRSSPSKPIRAPTIEDIRDPQMRALARDAKDEHDANDRALYSQNGALASDVEAHPRSLRAGSEVAKRRIPPRAG